MNAGSVLACTYIIYVVYRTGAHVYVRENRMPTPPSLSSIHLYSNMYIRMGFIYNVFTYFVCFTKFVYMYQNRQIVYRPPKCKQESRNRILQPPHTKIYYDITITIYTHPLTHTFRRRVSFPHIGTQTTTIFRYTYRFTYLYRTGTREHHGFMACFYSDMNSRRETQKKNEQRYTAHQASPLLHIESTVAYIRNALLCDLFELKSSQSVIYTMRACCVWVGGQVIRPLHPYIGGQKLGIISGNQQGRVLLYSYEIRFYVDSEYKITQQHHNTLSIRISLCLYVRGDHFSVTLSHSF